jgi:hypothetical protein
VKAAGRARARRLIILVPAEGVDETAVAQWVWRVASAARLSVLFLGLCSDVSEELQMRRHQAMLASLTRDPRIKVETRLEFGKSWSRMVKTNLTEGDILLCPAELRTGLWRKSLSQILSSLGAPVWTLTGIYAPVNRSPLKEIVFWFVSVGILIGFFFVQVRIARLPGDWVQSTLLVFSMLIEVGFLWAWHYLSS